MNIVVMGESMVDFSATDNNQYKQSFAGGIYNAVVYLNDYKRMLLMYQF